MTSDSQATPKTRPTRSTAAAAMAIGLISLAGCGSSSSGNASAGTPAAAATSATGGASTSSSAAAPAPGTASGSLSLEANREGQLEYDTRSLSTKAGNVSIAFTNISPVGHNMTIESSAGAIVGATPTFQGGSKTLTVALKRGTYKYFCSVPGHRTAGMEGTITAR